MQLLPDLFQVGGSLSGLTEGQVMGPFDDCSIYVVDLKGELVMIDCGNGVSWPQVEQNLRDWNLDPKDISTCIFTHAHYDHAGAAHILKKRGVTLISHPAAAEAMASGDERCCGFLYHKKFIPVMVDRLVEDAEVFTVGSLQFQAIHLPGHTMGCTAYMITWDKKRILFSGDVIGTLGYGHFGWNGSFDFSKEVYLQSLVKLSRLQFDVMLPGHGLCSFLHPRERVETSLNEALMQWR